MKRLVLAAAAAGSLCLPANAAAAPLTLADCLELADERAPQIAMAADKVAQAHAQLDEVAWVPWSQWTASATLGVVPKLDGSSVFSPQGDLSASSTMAPAWRVGLDGVVPITTFGKATHGAAAAAAFVDVVKAEGERARAVVRHDVRRAYFGLQLARDGKYLLRQLRKEIGRVVERMKADDTLDEADVTRVELFYVEMGARFGELERLEGLHVGTLRLLTGLEAPAPLEIPEDPISAPSAPLGDELLCLQRARLQRPELRRIEAGMRARTELVAYHRARMLPDVGMYLGAGFASAPIVMNQTNAFVVDNYNQYRYGYALPFQWKPDLLPNAARMAYEGAQLAELRDTQVYALRGFAVEVVNAHAAAREAGNREKSYGEAERLARRWLVSTAAVLGVGLRGDFELFEPLRTYMTHRYNHLVAIHDLAVARSQLALATGDDAMAP